MYIRIWQSVICLVFLDGLNKLIMMKSVTENVVADVLIQETTACHHGTCGRVVKNDMSHGRKSPREIHACRPAS